MIHNIIHNWNNIDQHLETVGFCIDSSYFRFDDECYRQIFGTVMGNPSSPVLADMVLGGLLNTTIAQLHFKPPVLRKYVNDLILAIPLNKLKYAHDMFNNYDKHLQFTYEVLVRKKRSNNTHRMVFQADSRWTFSQLPLLPTKDDRCRKIQNACR